ncbi:MAG TPA: HipA N-terminal domain-containing protein [Burkholderiaceae bacterium]
MLPERIQQLDVSIGEHANAGQLLKASIYEFRYLSSATEQASVALLMPAATKLTWTAGELFPPMDQNLPEGDLYKRIRALFPKQQTTAMHMLALIGDKGVGRIGHRLPSADAPAAAPPPDKGRSAQDRGLARGFDELVSHGILEPKSLFRFGTTPVHKHFLERL